MFKKLLIIYTGLALLLAACKVDPKINTPLPANGLVAVVPPGWPQPVYTFSNNAITEPTFILGRYLFYETMLSADNTISCGSCHQGFVAFANAGHRVSHGINQINGTRNAPALFNLAWHPLFMADGSVNHIEMQPLAPLSNPIEMGENINHVISKLQATDKYKTLFKNAYGSEEVTSEKMLKSMAQFMCLLYSYNSKYDYFKNNQNNVQFSDQEARGYSLFLSKCNACHKEPLFSDFEFRNNGLPPGAFNDSGRAHATTLPGDLYKFKTPSLRNIALTAPYMHDGRFDDLQQCLDHYTNGVTNLTNLDPLLQNGIPMTAQEKDDIIAFLKTLTDYQFINDKRFMDPNFK